MPSTAIRMHLLALTVAVATGLAVLAGLPAGPAHADPTAPATTAAHRQPAAVRFVSPTPSGSHRLSGTVDLQVTAPGDTTAVRFYVDDIAIAEVTDLYAKQTHTTPVWRTATHAGWYEPGQHRLRAAAITPHGTIWATLPVHTTRPTARPGTLSLDGGWQYARSQDLPAGDLDKAVPPESLPRATSKGFTDVVVPDSFGAVWDAWNDDAGAQMVYRRTVRLSAPRAHEDLRIVADNCFFACRYFVNGVAVGTSTGGYLPATIDVTRAVHAGINTIAIVVDNRTSTLGDLKTPNTSLYWNFGGLVGDVSLHRTRTVALEQVRAEGTMTGALTLRGVGTNTSGATATVPARVWVTGPDGRIAVTPRRIDLTLQPGVGEADTLGSSVALRVPRPQLWDTEHPWLYTVHVTPIDAADGAPVTERTGFRTVAIAGEDLLLNGHVVSDLQGFDRHADYPGLGRTQTDGLADREIKQLRQRGFRIFRPAHYPTTPAELAAADRYGLLVIEEINQITSQSAPVLAKPETQAFAKTQLTRMVARDASHPSLFAFSVGNENDTTTQQGADYVKVLTDFGRSIEPSRLYTAVTNHTTSDVAHSYVDFLSENYYAGWYQGTVSGVLGMLDAVQAQAKKPVLITEYGAEAADDAPGTAKGSAWYQAYVVDEHNRLLAGRKHFIGKLYWTSTEFWCTPGWAGGNPTLAPPFHLKGLQDWFRRAKLADRVMFSPVRVTSASVVAVPAGHDVRTFQHVVVSNLTSKPVTGRLVADPPKGFRATAQPTFRLRPGGSAAYDVPLAGRLDPTTTTETGFMRAVIDQHTEALPGLLTIRRADTTAAPDASDDFATGKLDPRWTIVREQSDGWSLTDRPGSLQLTTLPGDEYGTDNDGRNLFVDTRTPATDLTASARVTASAQQDSQQVGLLLYRDDDNYVKIDRGVSEGQQVVYLTSEVNGVRGTSVSVPYADPAVSLRLVRRGSQVTGEWSSNGRDWYVLGTATTTGVDQAKVALQAAAGTTGAPAVRTYVDSIAVSTSGGVDVEGVGGSGNAGLLTAGTDNRVPVAVGNGSSKPVTVRVTLDAPSGWSVTPTTATVPAFGSTSVAVTVRPPATPTDATLVAGVSATGTPVYGAASTSVVTAPDPAAVPLALDAGCSTSPVAAGWTRLTAADAWSSGTKAGWVGTLPQCRDRGSGNDLQRDLITSQTPGTLRVAVPAGPHRIAVLVGDRGYPADPMTIAVNGTTQVSTPTLPDGQSRWFFVTADGGAAGAAVDLGFAGGAANLYWRFQALAVLPS